MLLDGLRMSCNILLVFPFDLIFCSVDMIGAKEFLSSFINFALKKAIYKISRN